MVVLQIPQGRAKLTCTEDWEGPSTARHHYFCHGGGATLGFQPANPVPSLVSTEALVGAS